MNLNQKMSTASCWNVRGVFEGLWSTSCLSSDAGRNKSSNSEKQIFTSLWNYLKSISLRKYRPESAFNVCAVCSVHSRSHLAFFQLSFCLCLHPILWSCENHCERNASTNDLNEQFHVYEWNFPTLIIDRGFRCPFYIKVFRCRWWSGIPAMITEKVLIENSFLVHLLDGEFDASDWNKKSLEYW